MMAFAGRRLLAAVCIGLAAIAGAGCSSDDSGSSAVLDDVAPTRADIARDGGITFPSSTDGFNLVRIAPGQIDVTFTIDAADVDEFASGSGITLTDGERSITHASPLWNVAVTGDLRGGSSERNDIVRSAEVIVEADTATVRLTLKQPERS